MTMQSRMQDEGHDEAQQAPLAWQLKEAEAQRDAAERACATLRAELAELAQERDLLRAAIAEVRAELSLAQAKAETRGALADDGIAAREAEIVELKDDLIEAYRETRRLRRALEARS
jgi:predicted  nucleic acid-binding Zn-ribbon protein